jgi:hypothetical protein
LDGNKLTYKLSTMIKLNEIRVGNTIMRESNGARCTVNAYMIRDLYEGTAKEYTPLLIDDAILEQYGFMYHSEKRYWELPGLLFSWPTWKHQDGYCVHPFGENNGGIVVKYLHELQNIFYDHTKRELSRKDLPINL